MVDLGAVSGGFGSPGSSSPFQEAYAINNSNQVTGYAETSPLVDGNGNGYLTPYVANVTNAFRQQPEHHLQLVDEAGPDRTTMPRASGFRSIPAGPWRWGAKIRSVRKPRSTTAGQRAPAVPWVFPMPVPTGSGLAGDGQWTQAVNNAGYALCSVNSGSDGVWPTSWD